MGQTVWICTWNLQMDRQTDVQTYSSNYNIDIKGHCKLRNLYFWLNLSANGFKTFCIVWEFENHAWFLSGLMSFDFHRQVTDGQTHISHYNIDIKGYGEVKNLHFLLNLSANSFVRSIFRCEFQICA